MTILRGFTPTLTVNAIQQVSIDLLFPQAVRNPVGEMTKKQLQAGSIGPHGTHTITLDDPLLPGLRAR